MKSPEKATIKHLSYSTLDAWQQCGKKVQLAKLLGAPATPAWWLAGGSAVHAATEVYDIFSISGDTFHLDREWKVAFEKEISEREEKGPDRSTWRQSKEGYAEWNVVGPQMVQAYIDWRERSTNYEIWVTPDGEPAIELDVSGDLPQCPLTVKKFVDRVFRDKVLDQLIVVDLKTGTRKPESPLQFGVYAAGLTNRYGVRPSMGAAFMNRRGELAPPYRLEKYTPEYIGRQFGLLAKALEGEVFIPHVTSMCRFCDVSRACYAADGDLADRYDPDHPAWKAPF